MSADVPSMTREAAVALVESVMSGELAEEELEDALKRLDAAFGCPRGHVAGLVYWPEGPQGPEPTAAEVVDRASAYRPIAL
ncbi:e9imm peptide [Yinghuangia aomiensis]